MPEYIRAAVAAHGVPSESFDALEPAVAQSDVLYVTRVQ